MAGPELKFDLSLHWENLVPGVACLASIAIHFPPGKGRDYGSLSDLIANPFAAGIILIATAYLLGVSIHIASRLIIDSLSRITLRWIFIYLFEEKKNMIKENPSARGKGLADAMQDKFIEALGNAACSDKAEVRQEVSRRRERGRMLRSMWIPGVICLWPNVSLIVTLSILIFILYAYSELMVYQEASLLSKGPKGTLGDNLA